MTGKNRYWGMEADVVQKNNVQAYPGKVISRTFSICKENFSGLLLFAFPTGVFSLLVSLPSVFANRQLTGVWRMIVEELTHSSSPDLSFYVPVLLRTLLPLMLISLFLIFLSIAATYFLIPYMTASAYRYLGRRQGPVPLSVGQVITNFKSKYWKTIVLALVSQLYQLGVALIIMTVYSFVSFFSFILLFIPIIGWLLLILLELVFFAVVFLALLPIMILYPVAVYEDRWGFDALGRAFQLVFSQMKTSILSCLGFGAIICGISLIGVIPLIISVFADYFIQIPRGFSILFELIGIIFYCFVIVLGSVLQISYGYALHERTVMEDLQAQFVPQFTQQGNIVSVPIDATAQNRWEEGSEKTTETDKPEQQEKPLE